MVLALLGIGVPRSAPIQAQSTAQIAFVQDDGSARNIFLINPDGSGLKRLTNGSGLEENVQPVWSPDRTKIAFTSSRNENFELFVMNPDGSNQQRISPGDGAYSETPSWSPDSRRIVYVASQTRGDNIAMINLDGTGYTVLTEQPGDYAEPEWSPDGRTIAYLTYGATGSQIYLMDNNGKNTRLLLGGGEEEFDSPSWSPDGKSLAYVAIIYGNNGRTSEIYIRDMTTNQDTFVLSAENQFVTSLSWSDDSTQLAYTVSDLTQSNRQVRIATIVEGTSSTVTPANMKAYEPSWTTPKGSVQYGEVARNEVVCDGTLPSRLVVGERGRVTPGGINNILRSNPGTRSSRVGSLDPNDRFEVIGGPECADGYTWWEVRKERGGSEGWTAEAAPNEYWLQPIIRQNFAIEPPAGTSLLSGGRGLTTGRTMSNGEFQVEGYCGNQGYRTTRDNANWYCLNRNGSRAFMLSQADYDKICQQTYNNSTAVGVRDGRGDIVAFRWRCYGASSGSAGVAATSIPPTSGGVGTNNPDALAVGERCAGRASNFAKGDTVIVDFNRGSSLRILEDYRSTVLRTVTVAYDNETLDIQDGAVCWGGLIYWYVSVNSGSNTFYGWAAESDATGNPFICPQSNPECRS
jgi:TolB protein